MKYDLVLIFLNYNGFFWLKKALDTLNEYYLKNTKLKVKVVVVDNNSTDDSVLKIKKHYENFVDLIQSDENLGFAGGNNLALKKYKDKAHFFMLLNSDVEFTKDSNLDLMVSFLKKHPKVKAIGPKVVLSNNTLDWACHRGEPTPFASLCYFLKLDKFLKFKFCQNYHKQFLDLDKPHEIDNITGAAFMFTKDVLDKIGFLDERFFMYGEDLDFAKRIRDKGYKVFYFPKVKIIHHKYKSGIKSSSKGVAKKIKDEFYNSMLIYYEKHNKKKYPYIFYLLLKLIVFIKKGGI